MGAGIGHDFSDVRIHDDAAAAGAANALAAAAFTVGAHIMFGAGRYNPSSHSGLHLLAHELAHVAQTDGAVPTRGRVGSGVVSQPSDPAEVEAAGAVASLGWGGLQAGYPPLAEHVEASGTRAARSPVALTRSPKAISRLQLTYDDGPDTAGNTRRVLDALNAAGARATFYLVGKRVAQGDNWRIVFDMAAAGHWLGNHAYDWNDATDNHIFLHGTVQQRAEKILQTEWAIRDALIRGRDDAQQRQVWDTIPAANRTYIADVIASGTGRFRTPGFKSHLWTTEGQLTMAAFGSVNQVLAASGLRQLRITEVGIVAHEGVVVDPEDWRKGRTSAQISTGVTGEVSSDKDSVLLHSRIAATAEATPVILADFAKRKFRYDPTVQGKRGWVRPSYGFAGLSTISTPPKSAEIAAAKAYFRSQRTLVGPYVSGSLAIGILQLAQEAGQKEVDDFLSEIRSSTINTPTGDVPLANWMVVNPDWRLFLGFYENWRLERPFPRIKGVTL